MKFVFRIFGCLLFLCSINAKIVVAEVDKEIPDKVLKFSDKFKSSLKECFLYTEKRSDLSFEARIMGKKDGKCLVRTNDFDFYLSDDKRVEIIDFEDLYNLIKDRKYSKYRMLENYYLSEFFTAIKYCSEKKEFSSGIYEDGVFGDVKIKKSAEAKLVEDKCVLRFMNKLAIGEVEKDYSLKCDLSYKHVDMIVSGYGLDKYDEERAKNILINLIKKRICVKDKEGVGK